MSKLFPKTASKIPVCLLLLLISGLMLGGCGADSQEAAPFAPLNDTAWIAQNDGSQWLFRSDGTFSWYQDKTVTDDNYYAGTFTVKTGEEALDCLDNELADFGYSRQNAEKMIEMQYDQKYSVKNFIAVSCQNESFMLQGEEQLTDVWPTAYCGFLVPEDNKLVLLNLSTGNWYWFGAEEAEA